jgi:hypothetical protein
MASMGMRISEKRMAASKPKISMGWRVTSAASSGFLQSSRKLTLLRIFWYWGRYLPAWRMNQTGV